MYPMQYESFHDDPNLQLQQHQFEFSKSNEISSGSSIDGSSRR